MREPWGAGQLSYALSQGRTVAVATATGVALGDLVKGRKVVIFAVPGAYTPTCSSAHVPSFIRTKAGFDEKGVDEIICLSVNDPFVMAAWAKQADAHGITMLADGNGTACGSWVRSATPLVATGGQPASTLHGTAGSVRLWRMNKGWNH